MQLAAPGTWHLTAELKFHHPPLHSAGKTRFKSILQGYMVFLVMRQKFWYVKIEDGEDRIYTGRRIEYRIFGGKDIVSLIRQ